MNNNSMEIEDDNRKNCAYLDNFRIIKTLG